MKSEQREDGEAHRKQWIQTITICSRATISYNLRAVDEIPFCFHARAESGTRRSSLFNRAETSSSQLRAWNQNTILAWARVHLLEGRLPISRWPIAPRYSACFSLFGGTENPSSLGVTTFLKCKCSSDLRTVLFADEKFGRKCWQKFKAYCSVDHVSCRRRQQASRAGTLQWQPQLTI